MNTIDTPKTRKRRRWDDPGMHRVRLLVWKLYRGTLLNRPIDQNPEMDAAAAMGSTWDQYLEFPRKHPGLSTKAAAKRELAKVSEWRLQSAQLRRHRKQTALQAHKEFRKRLRSAVPKPMRDLPTDPKIAVVGMESHGIDSAYLVQRNSTQPRVYQRGVSSDARLVLRRSLSC